MAAKNAGEAQAAARTWAGKVARDNGLVPLSVETEPHGSPMPRPTPIGTLPVRNEEQLEADRQTIVLRLPEDRTRDEVEQLKDALVEALTSDNTLAGCVHSATLDDDAVIDIDPSRDFPGNTWRLQFPMVTYRVIQRPHDTSA
jgi:hypothetical protein